MTLDYLVTELQQQEKARFEKGFGRVDDYFEDDPAAWQQQETDKAIAHVRWENQKAQEERWGIREAAAERVRQSVRLAESDPESWLRDTLQLEEEQG